LLLKEIYILLNKFNIKTLLNIQIMIKIIRFKLTYLTINTNHILKLNINLNFKILNLFISNL